MKTGSGVVVVALVAAFAAGCAKPAHSPAVEASSSAARVQSAQMTATVGGSTVGLEARIWLNLMPRPGSRSTPVRIMARLVVPGAARPKDLTISRLWFVSSSRQPIEASIVSSLVTQEGLRLTGSVEIPRNLPERGWVVAEIRDPAGSLFLRSPETGIQKIY